MNAKKKPEVIERIVNKVELSFAQTELLLRSFGLTPVGESRSMGGGRIASNVLFKTEEHADAVVRIYPRA